MNHEDARKFAEETMRKARPREPDVLMSVRASAVQMTAIEWLWDNRIALGALAIIAGLPDEGKGQILCYIAAMITTSGMWPCDEGRAPQGNVIVLTAEDDLSNTVVPRLAAAGADLNCIEIVKMVRNGDKSRMFNLMTDLELLQRKIEEVGDVRQVQIDPLSAYQGVGKMDSFRGTDVRAILGPVVDLASMLKISFLGIMHFNKKIDITNALLRISDSLAYGAAARHVYGVVDDPENKRKLLVRAKNNLSSNTKDKALAYHFGAREVGNDPLTGQPISAPYVLWEPDYVDVTASEAMRAASGSKSPAARDDAKKFLADILASGPIARTEIDEAAEANGISKRTLFRAKDELKVTAKKNGFAGAGGWSWTLPDKPASKPWNNGSSP